MREKETEEKKTREKKIEERDAGERQTGEKKTDLRVLRTKQSLRSAFREMAQKKPVNKITVTELAEKAMINKGTFYLHYKDIYDLYMEVVQEKLEDGLNQIEDYSLFFEDPKQFVETFFRYFGRGQMKEYFPMISEELGVRLPVMVTEKLKQRLYQTGRVEKTPENEVKLDCALICFFMMGGRYRRTQPECMVETISTVVNALFPPSPL